MRHAPQKSIFHFCFSKSQAHKLGRFCLAHSPSFPSYSCPLSFSLPQLTSRLTNDVAAMSEPINWQLSALMRNTVALVGGILLCFLTSWKLSILAFTTMAPILHITAVYSRWSRDLNRSRYAVRCRWCTTSLDGTGLGAGVGLRGTTTSLGRGRRLLPGAVVGSANGSGRMQNTAFMAP